MIVASAGNETADLQHPLIDDVSPDWPPGAAVTREVRNNCRVAPAELPEADGFRHRASRVPRLRPDHRRLLERGHVPGGRDRPWR